MAISRRARERDGKVIEPMTLANMRENGVHSAPPAAGEIFDTRPHWLEQGGRRKWC